MTFNPEDRLALPEQRIMGFEQAGTVAEFWRWGFADLQDDDVKGWFAEWMVAKLLKIDSKRRISWADSDLIVGTQKHRLRIEVKSTAYWQSYKLLDEFGEPHPVPKAPVIPGNIRWRIKPKLKIMPDAGSVAKPEHRSDLYVFALQTNQDWKSWNALDLNQWEFYMAPRKLLLGKMSITPSQLTALQAGPFTAYEFSVRGREEIVKRGFGEYTASFAAERMADEAQYGGFTADSFKFRL